MKRKIISILIVIFILLVLIIINSYTSANAYSGYMEIIEKVEQDDKKIVTIHNPDFGLISIQLKNNQTINFTNKPNNLYEEIIITEIWNDLIVGQEYYMNIKEYQFPWSFFVINYEIDYLKLY
ncbi:hypothetical protein [Bacillus sp. JCM 19034]|uniref:hypothetical protein n=1 Tax=Bacillus sp. JCM 19034 TaxID=1481928 RepID=UPI0007840B65|nr:hypothetical protein [Bacillus sp. JCM 19034]